MRWHRGVETDDVLRHPADAEEWKHFDSEFSNFASDPRNVCLGLALNEFNPFGQMSTPYNTMSFPRTNFLKMDVMFLKFADDLDNLAGGSSSMGDNSAGSSSQPFATLTPRRRVQSQILELERYNAANGQIPMMIAPGAKKPIFPHVVRFSQVISMCMRRTFPVCCLKWVDVDREYIEVVKGDLQRFFVLDFNDQAMNRFVEHRCSPPLKSLGATVIDTLKSTATPRKLVPTHYTY
ncbi:CACTA en-spm transposon protein [Cucumis melo var. makuwa]|uniref:CACTA en-spm transposon protein n=1 Tax=Cucumis melo var. makuwa TaxID=1194695 RepID=A0A5A7VLN4_CUCMM|nr:CACTA en-spm transposon protein [Cucumis melo var. makuwa]TYK26093.1 CACTA en-spm transposon protein [Cucumis melo var. makuwa]